MEIQEWEIVYYQLENRRYPFLDWFDGLRDCKAKVVIDARLRRLSSGNFGNCKYVGHGILELKIAYGPGYRIYFTKIHNRLILLFCGGNKASQSKDIQTAQSYLEKLKGKQK